MSPKQELIQVSAGLASDGGGTAVVSRMIAEVGHAFGRSRSIPFRILSLGPVDGDGEESLVETYEGRKLALSWDMWRRQHGKECRGVIFDHPGPARVQALIPQKYRAPYMVFLYGIDVWRRNPFGTARSLGSAAAVVAISEFTKAKALEAFPGVNKIDVLYPALEERSPSGTVDARAIANAGSGYLMIVGRMAASERYKGHDQLLTAMPQLKRELPQATLVVVGDGDDRPRLESRARDLGLETSVHFTGFVSEATLDELYRHAGALVMPSSEEGFGLVYLEAMRAGKPCIGARGSAAEEIIVDGATGLLVNRASEEELLRACLRLLAEPEFARSLGEQGRRRWEENFRRRNFHRGLQSLLERLTGVPSVRD